MKRTFWHNDATPVENTLDRVMYEIKFDDTEGLLLDSVSLADIIEDSDGLMAFDALITPYARLPARMDVIKRVMIRAGTTVQPLNVQTSEPFMQNGTANVAAIFELSDGQTISIFFHNPDTTPKKILPTDELISWKWLLNKKDITIVVAAERGLDLNPRQVAVRIMKLAEKNSASFIRSNGKRAERMQALEDLKTEITGLEGDLKGALHRLEIAKVEKEDRDKAVVEPVKPVEKNKVTLVWSEASEAENKEFSTLNELQQFMREEYENDASKLPDMGYNKHKVIINGEASRIDVAQGDGDFNPFNDNLSKYLIADGFDVEIEPDLPSLELETADPEVIDPIIEPEVIEPIVEPVVEGNELVPVLSIPAGWSAVTDGKTQEGDYTLEGSGTHNQRYEPIRKAYIGEDASNFFSVARKNVAELESRIEPVVEGDQEILNGFSVKETIDELNRDYSTDNDVWNAEPSEIQALSEESYNKLSGALENANYHPENATFKTKRSGIEPVIDPELTATEEETNEQTNEQTEVETETEAAGEEGDSVDTIELTGNELGEFPDTEDGKKALRKAAEDYLQSIKNKWVPCSAIGVDVDVEIRKKGIDKVISASADIRKLKLISGIEKLITNGKKVGERPPYDSDTDKSAIRYITLRTKVLLDGKSLAIRTVIKEDNNGIFHYDFSVFEQEAVFDSIRQEKAPINEAFPTTTSNDGGTYPSRLASCQLKNNISQIDEYVNVVLDSTNSSKMVLNLFIEGEDSEVAESDESEANEVKQADPVATANINASSVSDAIKKKAIKYLQENPATHDIKGISAKSLSTIMKNIKSAFISEVVSLSDLFEVEDNNGDEIMRLDIDNNNWIVIRVNLDNRSPTGYSLSFNRYDDSSPSKLFDSTSTIEELRQWGFALPFDLDVKAFVANVIKPEVDKLLSQKEIKNEPETESESVPIPSDSDVVIAPEGEDSSEVDRQSEEQAEEDEPMEDFEPITPEVVEPAPTPTITGNTEIDGYKSKLLSLQQRQDRMKAVNKIVNNKKLTSEQKKSALADAGYTSEQSMVDAKPKWSDGKLGYEGYQLTNNNANISSTKKRITQLEAQDLAASKANSGDSQTSYDFDGGTIELDYSADRLKVDFDAIPDSDMNSKLKQNGFKWSPTNRVWQRQLTDNAISTANYLFGTNIKTAASIMTEEENKPRPNPIIQAVEPVQNETAEIDAEITEPSNNAQTEKISAYSDELDSIRQETNSIELMRRLNDIVARIEADNLMDEMDVKLNQASDAVDELFKEAQKNAV